MSGSCPVLRIRSLISRHRQLLFSYCWSYARVLSKRLMLQVDVVSSGTRLVLVVVQLMSTSSLEEFIRQIMKSHLTYFQSSMHE